MEEWNKTKTKIPSLLTLFFSLLFFGRRALPHSQYSWLSLRLEAENSSAAGTLDLTLLLPGLFTIFVILLNSVLLVLSVFTLLFSRPYSRKIRNLFLLIVLLALWALEGTCILFSIKTVYQGTSFLKAGNYVTLVYTFLSFAGITASYVPCVHYPAYKFKEWMNSIPAPKKEEIGKPTLSPKEENIRERDAMIDSFVSQGKRSEEEAKERKEKIRKK